MSDNINAEVLLVGAGYMAAEYAKVLRALGRRFIVVGRGEKSAEKFEQETGVSVHRGGLNKFLAENDTLPSYAIVAVTELLLSQSATELLRRGVKNILLEKPGAITFEEFQKLCELSKLNSAEVKIAYNRRFYSSTRKALEYIEEDGGVTSFQFEFTEWLHLFEKSGRLTELLPCLFLANSTHVVDLAFFLCGKPKEITCYKKATFPPHDANTVFAGAGVSDTGALFSYQANWLSAGRWSLEIMTKQHRLIFRPLEKLQIQNLRTTKIDFVEIEESLDVKFKPGVFLETQAFLDRNENFKYLPSLEEQFAMLPTYQKMSGGIQGM